MRYNPHPKDENGNIAFKDITDHLTLKQINQVRRLLSKYQNTPYKHTKIDWEDWEYSASKDCLYYQPFGEIIPLICIYCRVVVSCEVVEM